MPREPILWMRSERERHRGDRQRELLPGDLRRAGRVQDAELDELRIELVHARVHLDAPSGEHGRFGIHGAIEREEHLPREAPRRAEVDVERLPPVIREGGQREEALDAEDVVEDEIDVSIVDDDVLLIGHSGLEGERRSKGEVQREGGASEMSRARRELTWGPASCPR